MKEMRGKIKRKDECEGERKAIKPKLRVSVLS